MDNQGSPTPQEHVMSMNDLYRVFIYTLAEVIEHMHHWLHPIYPAVVND